MTSPIQTEDQRAAERQRVEAIQREAEGLSRDYLTTFSSPVGRKVWADIRARSFLTETTMDKDERGAVDPYAMAINEGARTLALYIKGRIEHGVSPDAQLEVP